MMGDMINMSYIHTYKNPNAEVGDYYFDSQKNCYMTYDGKVWISMTAPGAVPSPYYTDNTAGSPNSFTIGAPTATNMFEVNTSSGRIRANMATGEVFFPDGMHRSSALYEFWQGFSRTFMPSNTELSYAKQEISMLKKKMYEYEKHVVKEITEKIAEKLQKKYGNEKFIMTKPDDLIKLIKGES